MSTPSSFQGTPGGLRLGRTGFVVDVPLDVAAHSFFGAVLTCTRCEDQLGPVRSVESADALIVAHLARVHDRFLTTALCAEANCGKWIESGGLCWTHYSRALRARKRAKR